VSLQVLSACWTSDRRDWLQTRQAGKFLSSSRVNQSGGSPELAAVGLCRLNQVDPYPITCSLSNPLPIAYQMKYRFQSLPFKIQPAPLHRGGGPDAGGERAAG
jgi:hypothetical protein